MWRGASSCEVALSWRGGRELRTPLKSEWQAAEAIKIELLSLAARELLVQTGVRATFTHTRMHTHTQALLGCVD